MNTDNRNRNPKHNKGGDEVAPTRNAHGRWLPGHCPNPKGRPRKRPIGDIDQADIQHFKNTLVEVSTHEGRKLMTRAEALLMKIYEDAMKGKAPQQRFLYQEIEKNAQRLAELKIKYDRLVYDWFLDNPNFGKPGYEVPIEVTNEMTALRNLLHHYFPCEYPLESTNHAARRDEGGDKGGRSDAG